MSAFILDAGEIDNIFEWSNGTGYEMFRMWIIGRDVCRGVLHMQKLPEHVRGDSEACGKEEHIHILR